MSWAEIMDQEDAELVHIQSQALPKSDSEQEGEEEEAEKEHNAGFVMVGKQRKRVKQNGHEVLLFQDAWDWAELRFTKRCSCIKEAKEHGVQMKWPWFHAYDVTIGVVTDYKRKRKGQIVTSTHVATDEYKARVKQSLAKLSH